MSRTYAGEALAFAFVPGYNSDRKHMSCAVWFAAIQASGAASFFLEKYTYTHEKGFDRKWRPTGSIAI
ncbi:hypothetical protein ACFQZE_14515 [Paenibacillus sp. GCM10027627]|uniref:hypothetical protein n=1 Tax=unclassified Paenibacillus TaxID=185978 RepID=UPI0036440188